MFSLYIYLHRKFYLRLAKIRFSLVTTFNTKISSPEIILKLQVLLNNIIFESLYVSLFISMCAFCFLLSAVYNMYAEF